MNLIFQRLRSGFARLPVPAGLVFLALAVAPLASAQEGPPPEYDLKAAFLFHFGQFVQWPNKTFADFHAPLTIGIYGTDPFHGDLEHIVAHQNINGHPVTVRQAVALSDMKYCNVIFISAGEQKNEAGILAALKGAAVLTVTEDMEHFSQSGFMINLFVEDDKIRFAINETAAGLAGLKISPKLLSLVRQSQP